MLENLEGNTVLTKQGLDSITDVVGHSATIPTGPQELHMISSIVLFSAAMAATPDSDSSILQSKDSKVAIRLNADLGAVLQVSHRLQLDADGTDVRVPSDLGQDILYPFLRFQVDLDLGVNRRHTVALLYQPLDFQSVVAPEEDLVVGDLTFPAGRALRFRYGFPFYRATWLYDLAPSADRETAIGAGLQIRNANIVYTALDGSQTVSSRNIGPVPLLAFRARHPITDKFWWGGEMQGFYAPISVLNGSTSEVVGAIADGSFKLGLEGPSGADVYVALRYIGGGAVGESNNADPFTGDGFSRNWIHFAALTLGAQLR